MYVAGFGNQRTFFYYQVVREIPTLIYLYVLVVPDSFQNEPKNCDDIIALPPCPAPWSQNSRDLPLCIRPSCWIPAANHFPQWGLGLFQSIGLPSLVPTLVLNESSLTFILSHLVLDRFKPCYGWFLTITGVQQLLTEHLLCTMQGYIPRGYFS